MTINLEELEAALIILNDHNKWRRGEFEEPPCTAKELGICIEQVIEAAQKYARIKPAINQLEALADGQEDIDDNGNPNWAMRVMQQVDVMRGGFEMSAIEDICPYSEFQNEIIRILEYHEVAEIYDAETEIIAAAEEWRKRS